MKLITQNPKKALNKAFLKQRPLRSEIDKFKTNLKLLISKVDEIEREENQKNHLRDFLCDTYYKESNEINTKDTKDLVIHLGKTKKNNVGVIIEAKRPSAKNEMISVAKPNCKALHQIILYYFDEREKSNNNELKHLVITNIYEWFIFDANLFDKVIYRNTKLKKIYETYINDRKDTAFFYEEAGKIIPLIENELTCAYFDIRVYNEILRNANPEADKALIALQKLLSPFFLLKQPFANDSNSLNLNFYKELLYIIGLEEIKDGNKFIINRKVKGSQPGSLIENTINILNTEDAIHKVKDISNYGQNKKDQIYNIAFELSLTWVNRILFLKLLEGLLITYHKGDKDYCFMNKSIIPGYDELYKLFHQVLAINVPDRKDNIKKKYSKVPYLNSSLFEISELENLTIKINSLDDSEEIELFSATVLKEAKRTNQKLKPLEYLFRFLDAYDFASEGGEDIAEDNKTIINASVLGKVFEKINGYKDGSIFTPGFITMYMSRQALRLAVLQKFNDYFKKEKLPEAKSFDELYNKIARIDLNISNSIINSIRICDPAVGSGHFLVSVLNELIVIKSELGILIDKNGRLLKDYEIIVENDDLIISDENGIFEYKYNNKESQRVQETIFNEKQTLIENCLFGVDINPNSVKICRLRLWIELLKSSYYITETMELQTLPNIDIDIKCGNSLISKYGLKDNFSYKDKIIFEKYRIAVSAYKNVTDRYVKLELKDTINLIKEEFKGMIVRPTKNEKKLTELASVLDALNNEAGMLDTKKDIEHREKKKQKLIEQIEELRSMPETNGNGNGNGNSAIYHNAFEWRFEFPEVLNDDGDFIGFDLIIGNPPYFGINKEKYLQSNKDNYKIFESQGDIYSLFIERGLEILKEKGLLNVIISNKWLRAKYGESVRSYILLNSNPIKLIDFNQILIFDSAIVHSCILELRKEQNKNGIDAVQFDFNQKSFKEDFNLEEFFKQNKIMLKDLDLNIWNINKSKIEMMKSKIENIGKKLKEWDIQINYGVKTGFNEAFIINKNSYLKFVHSNQKNLEILNPILRGRDTRKYYCNYADRWMISTFPAKKINIDEYIDIKNHLLSFGIKRLEQSGEIGSRKRTLNKWFETQDVISYWEDFIKPKIIFSEIVSEPQFYYNTDGIYPEATVFFMTGEKIKYLTALLNSKAVTFFFKSFYMGGELVGKIRYKKVFLEQVPIPYPNEEYENKIIQLVDQILAIKKENLHADTSELEREIDMLVYELYDLTEEEIRIIVEGE